MKILPPFLIFQLKVLIRLRYLDGQNEYNEVSFSCSISFKKHISSKVLDLTLKTTELTEICTSGK